MISKNRKASSISIELKGGRYIEYARPMLEWRLRMYMFDPV
jgi:hypothetical protein